MSLDEVANLAELVRTLGPEATARAIAQSVINPAAVATTLTIFQKYEGANA